MATFTPPMDPGQVLFFSTFVWLLAGLLIGFLYRDRFPKVFAFAFSGMALVLFMILNDNFVPVDSFTSDVVQYAGIILFGLYPVIFTIYLFYTYGPGEPPSLPRILNEFR